MREEIIDMEDISWKFTLGKDEKEQIKGGAKQIKQQ